MRPIPAPRLGDTHGLLRAINQRERLRLDEFITEFSVEELFPPGLENALGRTRQFVSFARSAGLLKEDRGMVELTEIGKRYVRSSDEASFFDVSPDQAEWLRRQLRERHMTDSIYHGVAIGLSLYASNPPDFHVSTLDFGRALAYLGRAGWDNENTLESQGERYTTFLQDLELIDAERNLTEVGTQTKSDLTLPIHMSLRDLAGQLNPGGAEAAQADGEAEWAARAGAAEEEPAAEEPVPVEASAAEAPAEAPSEPAPAAPPPSAAERPVPPPDIWESAAPDEVTRAYSAISPEQAAPAARPDAGATKPHEEPARTEEPVGVEGPGVESAEPVGVEPSEAPTTEEPAPAVPDAVAEVAAGMEAAEAAAAEAVGEEPPAPDAGFATPAEEVAAPPVTERDVADEAVDADVASAQEAAADVEEAGEAEAEAVDAEAAAAEAAAAEAEAAEAEAAEAAAAEAAAAEAEAAEAAAAEAAAAEAAAAEAEAEAAEAEEAEPAGVGVGADVAGAEPESAAAVAAGAAAARIGAEPTVEAAERRREPSGFLDVAAVQAAAEEAGLRLPSAVYANAVAALASGKHLVITGPAGSGKTTLALAIAKVAARSGRSDGAALATASPKWSGRDTLGQVRPGETTFERGHVLAAAGRNRWLIIDELDRARLDKAFGDLSSFLGGLPVSLPDGSGEMSPPDTWRIVATRDSSAGPPHASPAMVRRFAVVQLETPAQQTLEAAIDEAADGDTTAAAAVKRLIGAPGLGAGPFIDAARHAAERNAIAPASEVELARECLVAYIAPHLEPEQRREMEESL